MSDLSRYIAADVLACRLVRCYCTKHRHGFVSVGNFPAYDIKFDDGVTSEVKIDLQAETTGRVAIEFEFQGKPSGILSTSSDLWLHCFTQNGAGICFEVPTEALIALCLETDGFTYGGDNGASKLKLIALSKLKGIATQIFEIPRFNGGSQP